MAEKLSTVETTPNTNPVSFLRVLYKNLILIVLITVFFSGCGILYSMLKVKPVYTASRSVILRTSVETNNRDDVSAMYNADLAKIYLPDVEKALKGYNTTTRATEIYQNETSSSKGSLSAGAVSVKYGVDSLIFKISYSDKDFETAERKLDALIKAADERLGDVIRAEKVGLIPIQEYADESSSSSARKFIILGVLVGLIISFGIVLVKYALDNTIKSKNEYEYLTGVSVIAVIDKVDDKKQKPVKRRKRR